MKEVDCSKWYNALRVRLLPTRYVCKAVPEPQPDPQPDPQPQPDPEPEPIPLPTDVVPLPQLISCVEIEALKAGDGEAKLEPSAVVVTMPGTSRQRIHVAVLNGKSRKHVWWTRDKIGANAINSTGYESLGTPLTGSGLIPCETGSDRELWELLPTGDVRRTGIKQKRQYACVAVDWVIPEVDRNGLCVLRDYKVGKDIHQFAKLSCIVDDLVRVDGKWWACGTDGTRPGIECEDGTWIDGKYGALVQLNGVLYAIDNRGRIWRVADKAHVADIKANPFIARVQAGLAFIVTDDPHQFWVFNGREAKLLVDHGMKDTMGVVFGGAFDFAGPKQAVWAHISNTREWRGYRTYKVTWT